MDNLITVVSLQGQAWAVAQDGSRRELQVGDTLAATEMVVTADGAQIDLQFANNQVLSLIGEQEMPAQALQDAQATPLSSPLTPINTPVTTSIPASQGSHALKEGHNFVQLVRIAEIIEADGFTPLTVARIQEIIKPLGMVLPERDFEDDRWKDNYSRNEHRSVDRTPPELQGAELEAREDFDAEMINLDLSSRFKDAVSGSDITYVAENLPKGLTINPKTGVISGKIDSSASQGGNTGTKGDYKVTITVTDPAGNSSEHDFVWTVTNPPPVATDDTQTIDEDTVATGNVIKGTNSSNSGGGADNDRDGDALVVTGFTVADDPTVHPAGSTVIITGVGKLTLNENGDYTFTPDKDWSGTVPDVNYTITDGEGGTSNAVLKITVTPVNDAPVPVGSIGDQKNEDIDNPTVTLDLKELFKDVDNTTDELTYSIKGLPAGLTFDPVTGVISGTIDKSASQYGPNNDGIYKVTVTATDPGGLTADQTFTWTVTNPPPEAVKDEGDTFKTVELNTNTANGVLKNDTDPDGDDLSVAGVVAGAATDPSATGVNTPIEGKYGTLVLQPDGSYIYTPDLSNNDVWVLPENGTLTDTFTYTVSDGEGGFDTAELVITINGHSDTPPFLTPNDENGPSVDGEITVYEKGLTAGSDPGKGHVAGGIINVSALDGLKSLTIGGTELTLTELENLTSGTPVTITVASGTLTLIGFEPLVVTKLGVDKTVGGKLSYSYELTADQDHSVGDGESLTLDIQLAVKDDQDAVSVPADNKLIVNVIDDVPTAANDANEVTEDSPVLVSGNVLDNDTKGADGVNLTGVQTGEVAAGSHVADGNIAATITGKYGTLTLNADGTYEYELDNNNLTVQGLGNGEKLTDEVFSYTITDTDGDKSTATLTITINGVNDGVTIDVPVVNTAVTPDGNISDHVVFESGLATGSEPKPDDLKVNSNFTLKALDGLDPTNAFSITYKDINGDSKVFTLGKDAIEALSTTPQTITTQYGELKLNDYSQAADGIITIKYDYLLKTAPTVSGDATNDDFVITVKDKDVDTAVGTISIKIVDDAPVAKPDTAEITEDAADNTVSGNVVTNDALGADVQANPVTAIGFAGTAGTVGSPLAGAYGKLTLNADGSYIYELDNSNPAVNALKVGDTLSEEFTYTITDADGDTSNTTLTITIKGKTDGDPGLEIEDKNGLDVGVNSIAEDATAPVTGTFTVTAPDGLKEISVKGTVVTAVQLADLTVNKVVIAGTEGTLTLTGFDPTTGVVSYGYQQTGTNKDHSSGKDKVTDSFEVIVTDSGGDSTIPQDLVILITDTAPIAKPDTNQVTEDSGTPATGNVITDTGDGKDVLGADAVTVTGVVKGTVATELSGSVGNNVAGDFGTLKLNADGSYTYDLDNANPTVNALKTGETLTDTFSYTIKDADGDWSTTTVTITINGFTDGEPTITPEDGNDPLGGVAAEGQATVYESGLTTDGPGSQSNTTTGEITVTAKDGLVSVTVGGKTLTLTELNALSGTPTAIITDYGKITLTGFDPDFTGGITVGGKISYTYELTKPFQNANPGSAGDENGFDNIALQVKDASTGSAVSGQLQVNIIDDAPSIGTPEDNTVDESALPGGSSENPANVTVTGNLGVRVGADSAAGGGSAAKVSFATEQADLKALNLSSGYDASNDPILVEYVVIDSVVTAYKGAGRGEADKVFTVTITNPDSSAAGYEFTLHKPLNHGTETKLDLPFDFAVIDGDNDPANDKFTITVTDDAPTESSGEYILDIVEDSITTTSENSFNTSADANPSNTVISVTGVVDLDVVDDGKGGKTYTYPVAHTGSQDFYGSVTVNANGSITYVPDENYSNPGSPDSFTYTTTNGPDIDTIKVIVNVTPVADAPSLEANKTLVTPEDTARSLELKTPVVTDKIQVPGATATTDYPERLGEITLTLTGTAIGTLTKGDGSTLISSGGVYKFVITDVADLHLNGLTDPTDATVNYVTKTEYEAIQAKPAEDRHENFDVKVSVDSYEVDASGAPQVGIASANNTQTITVDVHAVTDDVGLKVKEGVAQAGVKVVISDDGADEDKIANITFDEDTSFNLTNILAPEAFKDTDGSETRYLGLKGLPDGSTVTVGGVDYIIGESNIPTVNFGGSIGNIPALTILGTETDLPQVAIKPPKDFSGDLTGIQIVLGALDSDLDSTGATPTPLTDEVIINLHVKPVAGDVAAGNVETNEDTAVAFLDKVRVTDTGTTHGAEVIDSVAFEIPTGWTLTAPAAGSGWNVSGTGTAADKYTITFDATLTEAQREAVLKGFTIKPPAHSSKDATIKLTVTSTDTNSTTGTDTKTVTSSDVPSLAVKVTVKPVAESATTDSDGANGVDVTLTAGHVYTTSGEEDLPFDLGVDDTFKLSAGWSNEDGKWVRTGENWAANTDNGRSEDTFALLTPFKTVGNSAMADATTDGKLEGSVFTYSDGTTTFSLPFAGVAVKIPMQYLDTVKFTGPKDWAGVVKIQVQAGTVDYDEDAPNAPTGMTTSGEAWLTNLVIAPKADQVTLKVDAIITTLEDEKTTLKINPTTTDASETFNVTIKGITLGSKILYKGVTYTAEGESPTGLTKEVDGTYTLKIVNFDKTQQPELTPPKDSNATINLTVTAETVDTLTYIDSTGVEQTITGTDPSKNQTLPIEVKVQGVPDEPSLVLVQDKIYTEDAGNQTTGQLKVDLKDLITSFKSGETGVDGGGPDVSETVTLRLSDLPEGFTLEGAGPSLGGSGLTRVWVISESDLADVKIIVPKHYSGTVDFTAQPVVTENDNPSEVFFNKQNIKFAITPVPEATLSISSVLVEDTIGELQLAAVGSDPDEYISAVRIAVTDVEAAGITLYDANGVALTASGGVYTITNTGTTGAPSVFVKGPANFSGSKTLQIAYEVTDPMTSGTGTAVAEWKTAIEHTLNFGAVTDEIDLALGDITGGNTVGTETTVTSTATVKVGLNITQKADTNAGDAQDADGSEKFIHVVVSGVPDGVSVKGAVETSSGQWLLTVGGTDGIAFNTATVTQDLEFVVSGYAGTFEKEITITTYTQDTNATSIEKDSVKWTLKYENADPDKADLPELTLVANDIPQTEDTKFALGEVVTGTVATTAPTDKPFQVTVTVRTTPEDTTEFEGMTRTVVTENAQQVVLWTASTTVPNTAAGQGALDSLLGSINVVTPKDANSNNITGGKFNLDVNVSVHADGISRDAQAKPELEVKPVTDELVITVSNTVVDEGENISLNIGLSSKDDADGGQGAPVAGWTVVGDTVFVHIADGLAGELYVDGDVNTGSTTAPAGAPSGLTGGKYYEVAVADLDKLEFRPDPGAPFQTGKPDVTAWAPHTENNSPDTDIVVSTGKGSLEIQQSNSGYKATITATGTEADVSGDKSKAIELNFGTGSGLIDPSEVVSSAYISGLPSGFTVYMGADAGSATMANNAGENTWAIPAVSGQLPAYIAVLPPANWSGSLAGLNLTVLSGHAETDPTATVLPVAFEVTPVANGIEMTPTLSFGEAGQLIDLNLNASMQDPSKASGALNDAHTERTELTLSGFPDGEKVLFYTEAGVGNGNLGGRVVKGASGEYTISGLTQDELDSLKFVHGATSGVQEIDISARTYEVDSSNRQVGDFSTATTGKVNINISATTPTSGDDLFLRDGTAINGFGGDDTVQLRFGDKLVAGDFANLNSIEIINMKGESSGANSITGLTAADVLDMVGADKTLTIRGDSNDTVSFSAGTDWVASTTGTTTTFTNTVNNTVVNLDVILTD